MVSYNRISLERKKELDQPDSLSDILRSAFEFVMTHKFKIAGVIAAVFIGLSVVSGVFYFKKRTEIKAFDLLSKCEARYNSELVKSDPEKAYKAVKDNFNIISKEYPGTVAARISTVRFAGICYDSGNYAEAVSLYQKALSDVDEEKGFLKNIILNGLAYSYEAENDKDAAIKYFKMVADSGSDSALKEEALFSLGRIYAETGETAKSMEAYKKLVEDYPESMYIEIAMEKIAAG
jgi:tetratricopeptide (TPR) repeat protein